MLKEICVLLCPCASAISRSRRDATLGVDDARVDSLCSWFLNASSSGVKSLEAVAGALVRAQRPAKGRGGWLLHNGSESWGSFSSFSASWLTGGLWRAREELNNRRWGLLVSYIGANCVRARQKMQTSLVTGICTQVSILKYQNIWSLLVYLQNLPFHAVKSADTPFLVILSRFGSQRKTAQRQRTRIKFSPIPRCPSTSNRARAKGL